MAKLTPLHSVVSQIHYSETNIVHRHHQSSTPALSSAPSSDSREKPQNATTIATTIKLLLFVDTGMFPTHTPMRTLGVMENERWLTLPSELLQKPYDDQITTLQTIIATHYATHPRGLPLWGDIQRYCFWQILSNGEINKTWFKVDGSVLIM